jgi:hypothetical protein
MVAEHVFFSEGSTSCCEIAIANPKFQCLNVKLTPYLLRRVSHPAVDRGTQVGERRGHRRLPGDAAAIAGNLQKPHLLNPVVLLHHLQRMRKVR